MSIEIALNQMPGKPGEPDTDRAWAEILSKLQVSFGKELSPIGARPATREDVLGAARDLGGIDAEWCTEHGASVVSEIGGCGFDLAVSCVAAPALVILLENQP
jgi:hypothetical protein